MGSNKFLPSLQIILDGYRNEDPPTEKKLPVEVDVPKHLFSMGYGLGRSILGRTVRDVTLIAFHYLLCIGEYTVKGTQNESK